MTAAASFPYFVHPHSNDMEERPILRIRVPLRTETDHELTGLLDIALIRRLQHSSPAYDVQLWM